MFNIIMQENHLYIDPFTINNKSNCFMFAFILLRILTSLLVTTLLVTNLLVNKKAEIPQFRPIVCDNSENP